MPFMSEEGGSSPRPTNATSEPIARDPGTRVTRSAGAGEEEARAHGIVRRIANAGDSLRWR